MWFERLYSLRKIGRTNQNGKFNYVIDIIIYLNSYLKYISPNLLTQLADEVKKVKKKFCIYEI